MRISISPVASLLAFLFAVLFPVDATAQSDNFDNQMQSAPLIVLGDTFRLFQLERDQVVAASRDYLQQSADWKASAESAGAIATTVYAGTPIWRQLQKEIDELLTPVQRKEFRAYCFQYLVGKNPVCALRYAGIKLPKAQRDEIDAKSRGMWPDILAAFLADRLEMTIVTFGSITPEEDLRKKVGKPFRWPSGVLDDFWVYEMDQMPMEAVKVLSCTKVQKEIKLNFKQLAMVPKINKKWRRIAANSEGEDEDEMVKLAASLCSDIRTTVFSDNKDQVKRFDEILTQRYLLCEDLMFSLKLLGIEYPAERKSEEKFRESHCNFHVCLGALEHLRRYSMKLDLIAEHVDKKKLRSFTFKQLVPHGNDGRIPEIPESFQDLISNVPNSVNRRRVK